MSSGSPDRSERYLPQRFQEGNKLDLSGGRLSKVPKHTLPSQLPKITQLLLDNNELQRLDTLAQFSSVIELSASHNDIHKMCNVSSLKHLVRLDLSYNRISSIEGLNELVHLKILNLAYNKIKVIEQLQTNLQIEHLDLSENAITVITNINQLCKLKKLFLHKNLISSLKHCGVYLPASLETLTLAGNKLTDLNEVSHLAGLVNLKEITIESNPCVRMTGNEAGFDHRPFLINWCAGLKLIDGFSVDDIERLKGEWLYSQGRGRQFRPGEHADLVQYLVEACPLNNQNLQTDHERKLQYILRKAHHHQSQLKMAESSTLDSASTSKMVKNTFSELMSQSLDPSLLNSCSSQSIEYRKCRVVHNDHGLTRSLHCEPPSCKDVELAAYSSTSAPLPAASTLLPVPESLISPMVTSTPPLVIHNALGGSGTDALSASKLQTIKCTAEKKKEKRNHGNDKDQAATCIQKVWRGYHTRNLNPKVLNIYHHIQTKRTELYIQKLSQDMEATRAALDSEHRLQILQMQAINALWRKIVSLQPARLDECMEEVKGLAHVCDSLNTQVKELQSCMKEVLRCVNPSSSAPMATQTDIVAVHTPNQEAPDSIFPHSRPSTLSILPRQVNQCPAGDCMRVDVIDHNLENSVPNIDESGNKSLVDHKDNAQHYAFQPQDE